MVGHDFYLLCHHLLGHYLNNAHRFQVKQRAMERIITGISRIQLVKNITIRQKSQIEDVVEKSLELDREEDYWDDKKTTLKILQANFDNKMHKDTKKHGKITRCPLSNLD
jgi:uncharacterized protein YlbG (UPF0298 family)